MPETSEDRLARLRYEMRQRTDPFKKLVAMQSKLFCLMVLVILLAAGGPLPDPAASDPAIPHACTSFGLNNNGYLVFGANWDNPFYKGLVFVNKRNVSKTGGERGTTGEVAAWVSQYGSVTFNLAGYQLPWAGMNEAGLVISTMGLGETQSPAPDERPPLRSPLWLQYLLDNFGTVEEIVTSDLPVRIVGGTDHFLVCDRTAACAVIEFLDGEMVVYTGDTLPVSALTDNVYEESVDSWQAVRPGENAGTEGGPLLRFFTAADRVTSFEPTSAESAVDYAFTTLHLVSQGLLTRWSIVFDTENQRVSFKTHMIPSIRSIDFSALDFSCRTPVLMLDIQADLSGDVTGELTEYSHDVNLAQMLEAMHQWGAEDEFPEEKVNQIVTSMENFACTEETP